MCRTDTTGADVTYLVSGSGQIKGSDVGTITPMMALCAVFITPGTRMSSERRVQPTTRPIDVRDTRTEP